MTATTGYQAGVETTNTQISYAPEATWGALPSQQFQAIRYTSETLGSSRTRNRPSEILTTGEVAAAVTTKVTASGAVNFALSYGTYDDFLSGALNNDWQALQSVAGASADITITAGSAAVAPTGGSLGSAGVATLSSTTASKFANISVGQFVNLIGFTNAANNGIWRVTAKADSQHLTLASPRTAVTETPAGTAAQVRASVLTNSTEFKSFFIQQSLSSSLFLRYPGAFISGFTLTGGVGQFLSGNFQIMAQQELSSTTNASTGAVLAAPGGRIHDPVGGFGGVLWNNNSLSAVVDSFTVTCAAQGAQAEFGMGSAAAQGMIMGLLQATGQMKLFFKDFSLYSLFTAETLGVLSFVTKDPTGNAYVVTLQNAALMDPKIEAGGPGQPVYATFTIEGNPLSTGGTIQIDRLAAS